MRLEYLVGVDDFQQMCVTIYWYYSIYEDFDGDDMLGVGDLRQVVDRLTAPQRLNDCDMQQLLQYILDEADLDDDGALSFAEFEHIIEKSSDFSK